MQPNFVFMKQFVKRDLVFSVGGRGQVGYGPHREEAELLQLSTDSELNSIRFVDDLRGFVLGENGAVFFSKDSGKTWTKQNSATRLGLNAIDCVDKNNCWIVGKSGVLLKTRDGGSTWKVVNSGFGGDLFAVSFVSKSKGWIAGEKGSFLQTSDGGKQWKRVRLPDFQSTNILNSEGTYWQSIRFFSKTLGCLAGDNRVVCTADGGKEWKISRVEETEEMLRFQGFTLFENSPVVLERCGRDMISKDSGISWVRK